MRPSHGLCKLLIRGGTARSEIETAALEGSNKTNQIRLEFLQVLPCAVSGFI